MNRASQQPATLEPVAVPRASTRGGLPLSQTFVIAWRAILGNPLRSILTALGVIIGVGAVIALTSLGSGATSGASGSMRCVLGAGTLMRVIEEAGWTALKGPSESRISSRGPLMPTAVCSSVTKASSRAPGAASAASCSFAPSDVSELLRAAMSMGWVDSSSLATGQAYQRAHKTPLVPLV